MNDSSLMHYIQKVLKGYCDDTYTAQKTKKLLASEGVSVNLKTCWTLNKAEVEYKNKLYTIDV